MRRLFLFGCILIITACSSDSEVRRQEYLDADYYTRLELPPDLTAPEYSKELLLPEPTEDARTKFEQQTADIGDAAEETQVTGVAVRVSGARLVTEGSVQWLQIDESTDRVWQILHRFWEQEGILVRRAERTIGMMETDWVAKYQIPKDAGFFERAFSNFEPDRVDRFTAELEAGDRAGTSRVKITHAGMEVFVEAEDVNWKSRENEPALEREMLKRLALFVGAGSSSLESAYADYRPFAVRTAGAGATSFEVIGSIDDLWPRVLEALETLGIEVSESDRSEATMQVSLGDSNVVAEERDEYTESSWIMQMLSGKGDGEGRKLQIRLVALAEKVRVDVLDLESAEVDSVLAEQFSTKLQTQLL